MSTVATMISVFSSDPICPFGSSTDILQPLRKAAAKATPSACRTRFTLVFSMTLWDCGNPVESVEPRLTQRYGF